MQLVSPLPCANDGPDNHSYPSKCPIDLHTPSKAPAYRPRFVRNKFERGLLFRRSVDFAGVHLQVTGEIHLSFLFPAFRSLQLSFRSRKKTWIVVLARILLQQLHLQHPNHNHNNWLSKMNKPTNRMIRMTTILIRPLRPRHQTPTLRNTHFQIQIQLI